MQERISMQTLIKCILYSVRPSDFLRVFGKVRNQSSPSMEGKYSVMLHTFTS